MAEDRAEPGVVRKAIEERNQFLEKRPELRPFQEEIDRRLTAAGSMENRMAVLGFMLQEQIMAFGEAFWEISEKLRGKRETTGQSDPRGSLDRRSGGDRRVFNDASYSGPERRSGLDRRGGCTSGREACGPV